MAEIPPHKKRRISPSGACSPISPHPVLSIRDPSPISTGIFHNNEDDRHDHAGTGRNRGPGTPPRGDSTFDSGMITAVVGEELSVDVLARLKDVSGGNMERGASTCHCELGLG